ncbi:MAG: hypothetical protein HN742_00250 [Lentisphaerae bacterium]|jgi:hypothetical protein|nr:hypothetical protein [Lentisphaerota bacterium]MBT4820490.1 hypothetical protein [Lentisphaerota bacterium]MBT5608774.1 hypothetical protein [Lentisphaerota bacterium]MBT7058285.1 hypothetical protein [Lentisphaerota bacterium]MBT7840260.1 hypothetical protein [Lentisphaerota bacterium]
MDAREYLAQVLPTTEQVDHFVCRDVKKDIEENNKGWTYDAEVGWVLKNSFRDDGVDGARTFYNYDANGARTNLCFPGQTARIHTYGNSMTHCDQVSDGETWQEYLGSHIGEPIENYGVGGYSVYQAYRRMRVVEATRPAKYIVLNIFNDDHFRNLDALRGRIRHGAVSPCSWTLPHLRVDPDTGTCEERDNLCPTVKALYGLTDLDVITELLEDDPILEMTLALKNAEVESTDQNVPLLFGLRAPDSPLARELGERHVRAALFATQKVVELFEAYTQATGKKLMVVLSHGRGIVKTRLLGKPDWDESLMSWLKRRPYPVIDFRDAHQEDYARWKPDPDTYLDQYSIGHYAPAGNFFCAQAMKDDLVTWLEPKPRAYLS